MSWEDRTWYPLDVVNGTFASTMAVKMVAHVWMNGISLVAAAPQVMWAHCAIVKSLLHLIVMTIQG